jgi:transcriptional regulator with XRE-family HTH domain
LGALQKVKTMTARPEQEEVRIRKSHSFAARLQKLREERRMSKAQLGTALGVSSACVSHWEGGKTEPRPDNLTALAHFFNVSSKFLQFGSRTDPREALSNEGETAAAPQPPIAVVISEAKQRIAHSAGIKPRYVKIFLDFI